MGRWNERRTNVVSGFVYMAFVLSLLAALLAGCGSGSGTINNLPNGNIGQGNVGPGGFTG